MAIGTKLSEWIMVKISHLNSAMKNWLMINGRSALLIFALISTFQRKEREKNRTSSNNYNNY